MFYDLFAHQPLRMTHVKACSPSWWASLRKADLLISHVEGWVHAPPEHLTSARNETTTVLSWQVKKKKEKLKTKSLLDDVRSGRASLRLACPTTMWKKACAWAQHLIFSSLSHAATMLSSSQWRRFTSVSPDAKLGFGFSFLAVLTDESQISLLFDGTCF